jgi:(4S)-4-hydroxy-5-phosphonooxypentane-2,3-dione isomerase
VIVTCVTVYVKKEYLQDFITATIENHENSIKEKGNLRFDFLQCNNDATRFFLYEAYESEEASIKHKTTPHYIKWRDTVKDWMEKPRDGIAHSPLAPLRESLW